jgi:TonB family protein
MTGLLLGALLSQADARPATGAARCEAMLQETGSVVLRQLNAAACFDDEWLFKRAAEALTEAVRLLQAEALAGGEPVPPGGAQVFAGAAVPAPARTNNPPAVYPSMLVLKGVKGVVVTEVVLDREGRVKNVRIVDSIPELDRFAVELVRGFRFEPTRVKNTPVEVAMFIPVRYGLPSEPTPGDRVRLAATYYREKRVAVASQTAALALYHANRDVARYRGDAVAPVITADTPTVEVQEPKRVKFVEPVYPEYVVRAGVTGRVTVAALIDVDGNIGRARISRGIHGLDAAAVDAVLQWQYTPTIVKGEKATVFLTVEVNYGIRK